MTEHAELHLYQCWVCRTTLTTPIKSAGTGAPYRCLNDRTPMTYKFSAPVETDADRALVARGTVYSPHTIGWPKHTARACDTCRDWVEPETLIRLGAGGKYCSAACADIGTEKHRATMERVEQLYQERPWLRPKVKETA